MESKVWASPSRNYTAEPVNVVDETVLVDSQFICCRVGTALASALRESIRVVRI